MSVSELDIFTSARAKMLLLGGWFAAEQVKFHFGRRPPNAAGPPLVVIAVEESTDPDVESDGGVEQKFDVEIAVYAVGPDDAAAAAAQLATIDPRWYSADHGFTLPGTDQSIVAVYPKRGSLRLIEPLRGGEDQYVAKRRYEFQTAAQTGN